MQEHHRETPEMSGQPGYSDSPDPAPAQPVRVHRVGPKPTQPASMQRGAWLSSPFTWLSLATLLAAVIVILFLMPVRNTATDNPPERVQVPED